MSNIREYTKTCTRVTRCVASGYGDISPVNHLEANLAAYAEAKLGLLQVTTALAAAGVDARACHPGLVWTPMLRGFLGPAVCGALEAARLRGRLFRTPAEGANTVLAAVVADDAAGAYFVDGAIRPRLVSPEASRPPPPDLWAAVLGGAAPSPLARRVRDAAGG